MAVHTMKKPTIKAEAAGPPEKEKSQQAAASTMLHPTIPEHKADDGEPATNVNNTKNIEMTGIEMPPINTHQRTLPGFAEPKQNLGHGNGRKSLSEFVAELTSAQLTPPQQALIDTYERVILKIKSLFPVQRGPLFDQGLAELDELIPRLAEMAKENGFPSRETEPVPYSEPEEWCSGTQGNKEEPADREAREDIARLRLLFGYHDRAVAAIGAIPGAGVRRLVTTPRPE
jgi:hypothetical protein